jgi:hypothetical protein
MLEPGTLTVAKNAWNARRFLRVRPHPGLAGLVQLTVYNSLGNHAYDLAMTPDEAGALAAALRDAPWRPPDA